MKKLLVPLTVLIVLSFLLSACGNPATTTTSPTVTAPVQSTTAAPVTTTTTVATTTSKPTATAPATSTAPTTSTPVSGIKYGGVFKFIDPRAPSTTLGWFAEAGAQGGMWSPPMLETFLECDINGKFSPMLATNWEVAADLKTITLTLRKGVKFHDGSDLNATVAKWNLDQMIAARVSTNYTNMSSIDILDDYTIRINLSRYQNTMLNTLAATYLLSKTAFDTKGGKEYLRWNPVGTGPFKFVSFERDVAIKFTRFDGYWQPGKPYLNGVEMYFVADPLTMATAFRAEAFDAAGGDLSSVFYDIQQQGYDVIKCFAGAYTLATDSKNPTSPFYNLKVRQAIDYAIDREALVKTRGFGYWATNYQFANPGTPAYITNLQNRSYDPAKARQLLTEAGYPTGFKTSIYADVASSDRDAITAIQNYLLKVGINAELNILDFASYGNYRSRGWNNAIMAGMAGFDANLNTSMERYWVQSAALFPSILKSNELQDLHLASIASKDFDPALVQKVLQYLYDNCLINVLWAGSRGDVIKPYVKDSGLYTMQAWPGWKPYQTWLNK